MATLDSVMAKIRNLIDAANAATGNNDTDLTRAVNVLIAGYNQGGTGGYYRYVTFMGTDNETVEDTVTIAPKYSCPKSAAPQLYKESTNDTHYSHIGWSLTPDGEVDPYILSNITEDITLYPVFGESVRYYTVRFWDGDKLCGTKKIPYGGSSDYVYKKIGHYFQGWTPEPVNVTSDMDCYGTWEKAAFAKDSWDQISANCRAGNAAEYYKVGDEREVHVVYDTPVDGVSGENIVMRVAHIGTHPDYSGAIIPGMVIVVFTPYRNAKMAYKADHDTTAIHSMLSYFTSDVFDYLLSRYDVLPNEIARVVRSVRKSLKSYFPNSSDVLTTDCSLDVWPLSKFEVFGGFYGGKQYGCYDIFKLDVIEEDGLYGKEDKRVMRLSDGTAVSWMLRDPHSVGYVDVVREDGSIGQIKATDNSAYAAFAFFV